MSCSSTCLRGSKRGLIADISCLSKGLGGGPITDINCLSKGSPRGWSGRGRSCSSICLRGVQEGALLLI